MDIWFLKFDQNILKVVFLSAAVQIVAIMSGSVSFLGLISLKAIYERKQQEEKKTTILTAKTEGRTIFVYPKSI